MHVVSVWHGVQQIFSGGGARPLFTHASLSTERFWSLLLVSRTNYHATSRRLRPCSRLKTTVVWTDLFLSLYITCKAIVIILEFWTLQSLMLLTYLLKSTSSVTNDSGWFFDLYTY